MTTSINFSQFCDNFYIIGRGNAFSYEGKKAIYEHLTALAEDLGEETITFDDPIALCGEFAEYSDIGKIVANYPKLESAFIALIQNNGYDTELAKYELWRTEIQPNFSTAIETGSDTYILSQE